MKKIIISSIVASAFLASQASAESDYIGFDIGNTTAEFTAKAAGTSTTEKDDGGTLTLKLGHQYDDGGRVTFAVQNINASDAKFYLGTLSYDYLIGDAALKPFLGATVGYGVYDVDNSDIAMKGVVYGAQAGLNYQATKDFSVEAGYRYLRSNMKDSIAIVDLEVDNIQNWFIGLNYHF